MDEVFMQTALRGMLLILATDRAQDDDELETALDHFHSLFGGVPKRDFLDRAIAEAKDAPRTIAAIQAASLDATQKEKIARAAIAVAMADSALELDEMNRLNGLRDALGLPEAEMKRYLSEALRAARR